MQQFKELDYVMFIENSINGNHFSAVGYDNFTLMDNIRDYDRATGFMQRYYRD